MKKLMTCAAALLLTACGSSAPSGEELASKPAVCGSDLSNRAYVVARDSDDLTVIDLNCLEVTGSAKIGTANAHMIELGRDLSEVFVTSAGSNEVVAVDAKSLKVKTRLPIPLHPTHLTMVPESDLMAVMLEDENAVAFVDAPSRQVVKVLHGFSTPHFMRFSKDGKKGYVANLSGNHITEVDMASLAVSGEIALEGAGAAASEAVAEGGFADAQIDETGVLYAAHGATGRVLAFDTVTRTRLPEIAVGSRPWVVFADHHFRGVNLTHVVPNFDSATVSLIDGAKKVVKANVPGDKEAYGVNYSSLVPGKAFVMNRVREEIAVMDLATSTVEKTLPVGGNTETASTSADGKYIVATVSRANRVVIIDAKTQTIVKTFENVGKYPWSVAIPGGQNYCH